MERIKNEPAVVIGVIAAAILAAVQYASGAGILGTDIADTIGKALDPTTGWAIPIVVGIVTRFFVSPARS